MENETVLLTEALKKDMALVIPSSVSFEVIRSAVANHINHLINNDFEKLVFLLYRIDVDETKMRALLAQKEGDNAALLIADLIIERQLQKIESRKKFKRNENAGEEESW